MTTIRVKGWKANQIDAEAKRYNTWCDVVRSNDCADPVHQEDGSVIYIVRETVKETEKAICVVLESGDIVGSTKGWKTWIPKSALV